MDRMNELELIILHYLQGLISEEEMKALVVWLNKSEENKKLFFQLKQVYDLRQGGLYPQPEEVDKSWERLLARLKQLEKETVSQPDANRTRRLGLELLKYAAVGIIFACSTLGIQQLLKKNAPLEAHSIELNVEAGPRMSNMTLPDGTKVVLNASSKFHFPDQFDAHTREVFLDGEAFFDVAHQKERPFIVHTSRQKISVLGTTFNVMDYSADDFAITTLVSGSVEIQPIGDGNVPEATYRLKPSQQAFLNKTTLELTTENIKIDLSRTWVNKMYYFRDEPLFRIAQRLEKIYGLKIEITDEALKDDKYTGVFHLESPIEEVLKIINYQKQFVYKIHDAGIMINSRTKKRSNNP
jgi:ferric-dicitrate binding protein FerR (iron transport regulator)